MDEIAKLQRDGGKFLRRIPAVEEIDMNRIPPYTPPSDDTQLLKFAQESKVKYVMSTSTISSALSKKYRVMARSNVLHFFRFQIPRFLAAFRDL